MYQKDIYRYIIYKSLNISLSISDKTLTSWDNITVSLVSIIHLFTDTTTTRLSWDNCFCLLTDLNRTLRMKRLETKFRIYFLGLSVFSQLRLNNLPSYSLTWSDVQFLQNFSKLLRRLYEERILIVYSFKVSDICENDNVRISVLNDIHGLKFTFLLLQWSKREL